MTKGGGSMSNTPVADGARVLADLHALRGMGAYRTGVHRPSLSAAHVQSLRWLTDKMAEAGLMADIDGIGNVLGRSGKPGPRLLAGSHLESQNQAGWLDGPLGVIYALEAARVINGRTDVQGSIEVASWCDEEGHFGPLLGSRSFIGTVTEAEIDGLRDRTDGRSLRAALKEAGLAGRSRLLVEPGRHIGYVEAHIEQGDTLEQAGLPIGIVTAIVGIWQYEIVCTGQQNHAGTTAMARRRDAGLAMARFCLAIDSAFPAAAGPRTVWTTGRMTLDPGAPSIIPGEARMLFQIRDADPQVVSRLEAVLDELAGAANAAGPCGVAVERLRIGKPAVMDAAIQRAFAQASDEVTGGRHMALPSGAGHDAQVLAQAMPAGMLFVPSIGGISHHWSEDTAEADIVTGAEVFVTACIALLRGAGG